MPANLIASGGIASVAAINPGGKASASLTITINGPVPQGIISTIAGNGTAGFSGDDDSGTGAEFSNPSGVATDSVGNVYIVDQANNRIRQVASGGCTSTLAGTGSFPGYSGDGGFATDALLNFPVGVAVDSAGNIFFTDAANDRVRQINTLGMISTVAGNGIPGFSGDGGFALNAQLNLVGSGLAVDAAGNLYIADTANNRIRKVNSGGIVTTVAGNGQGGFSGDGGPATSAALSLPSGVAVDSVGNLYIADSNNWRVRKVDKAGIISTYAGNGGNFTGGDGGQATDASVVPTGVGLDASGNLYIADLSDNCIRKVTAAGIISTVAGNGSYGFSGDGGQALNATLASPSAVAVDGAGNLFIADQMNNRIRKVTPATSSPSIKSGGIVPVYSTVSTIQPGEWVSIYGTNLANSAFTWTGNFPTSLGSTSVTINGKSAYLSYVSPTLINLQAPSDTTTGSVPVVVKTAGGTSTATVTLGQFGPSFSLLDSKHAAGIILRSNKSGTSGGGTYDIVGPTGNSLGYPTVAAKAGDTIELFAVGFGPTNPTVPAGQLFSGAAPTTNSVSILINNVKVIPSFAGLSGAGLYQINLVLPAGLGTGDVPLVATVGGIQTPSNVVISLQ